MTKLNAKLINYDEKPCNSFSSLLLYCQLILITADTIPKQAHITPSVQMQSIIGFGGAFTDSAGINLASLDNATQELLMQSYYGPNGEPFPAVLLVFIGCHTLSAYPIQRFRLRLILNATETTRYRVWLDTPGTFFTLMPRKD